MVLFAGTATDGAGVGAGAPGATAAFTAAVLSPRYTFVAMIRNIVTIAIQMHSTTPSSRNWALPPPGRLESTCPTVLVMNLESDLTADSPLATRLPIFPRLIPPSRPPRADCNLGPRSLVAGYDNMTP